MQPGAGVHHFADEPAKKHLASKKKWKVRQGSNSRALIEPVIFVTRLGVEYFGIGLRTQSPQVLRNYLLKFGPGRFDDESERICW